MKKKPQRGFTLIELMVTVAIIAILTSIALPAYSGYVLRGKLTEAFTNLADSRVKLEQYYQDNRNYGSSAGACVLGMPATKYFAYSCNWGTSTTPSDQTFTVTATGQPSEGTAGFSFTIDQSNTKTSVVTAPPAPAGWTSNPTCWVTKSGGAC